MGTFHQNKHHLHGITVVVETADEVYVGRCDDIDDQRVILLDADVFGGGDGDRRAWVEKAARFGVWPKHRRLDLPRGTVTAVTPLGQVAESLGAQTASTVTTP